MLDLAAEAAGRVSEERPGARGTETVTPAVRSDADALTDGPTASVGSSLELPGASSSVKSLGASWSNAEAEDLSSRGEVPGSAGTEGMVPLSLAPSKLDTSGKGPKAEEIRAVSSTSVKSQEASLRPARSSGAARARAGSPVAQFTLFDGRQWTLPLFGPGSSRLEPAAELEREPGDDREGAELGVDQVQHRLFDEGGVQLSFEAWRTRVAWNLRAAGAAFGAHTKTGRTLYRRAAELLACGGWCEEKTCTGCGTCSTNMVCTCDVRVCPRCSLVRANGKRRALLEAVTQLAKTKATYERTDGRGRAPYQVNVITFTARFDPENPDDCTPGAIADRFAGLKAAVDSAWEQVLSRDAAGAKLEHAAMHAETEVPFGGAIHVHVAYRGRFLDGRPEEKRPPGSVDDFDRLKEIVHLELGGSLHDYKHGRPDQKLGNVHVAKQTGTVKSQVTEACKYVTKASHPLRRTVGRYAEKAPSLWMDPALAAVVEIAFLRKHLSWGRGELAAINKRAAELEDAAGDSSTRCACGSSADQWQFKFVRTSFLRAREIDGVAGGARALSSKMDALAERIHRMSSADAMAARERMKRWARGRPPPENPVNPDPLEI